jgi:hypothetical protein
MTARIFEIRLSKILNRRNSKLPKWENSIRSIIEIERVVLAEIESIAKTRHRLVVGSHASALLS